MGYELSDIEWKLNAEQLKKKFLLFHDSRVLKRNIWGNPIDSRNDLELAIKATAYQIITIDFHNFFIHELQRIRAALANHRIDDPPDKFSRYILTNFNGLLKLQDTENRTKPVQFNFNSPRFILLYEKITLRQINYDLQTLFVCPLISTFEEDYQSEILPHPYVHAISDKAPAYRQITNPGNPKLRWNNQINVLVTFYYDLANTKMPDGEPYLNATPHEIAEHIFNSFTDKSGNDFSKDTIRTILKPSRVDKRAPEHKKFKIPF